MKYGACPRYVCKRLGPDHSRSCDPRIALLQLQSASLKGAEAYAPRFLFTAGEVFNMLRQAGGISVLAHPLQLQNAGLNLVKAIEDLAFLGMDGLETFYPTHSKKTRAALMRSAVENDLVLTGGSDFHGLIRPGTTLAGGKKVTVPYALLEDMKKRALMNSKKL